MDHQPYPLDLRPSDFWLFDYIKERSTSNQLPKVYNEANYRNSQFYPYIKKSMKRNFKSG